MSLMETFDNAAAGVVAQADWVITNVPVPPVALGSVVIGGGVFAFWCAINPFPRLRPTDTPVDTDTPSVAMDLDLDRTQVVTGGRVAGRARPVTRPVQPVATEVPYDPSYVPPPYTHHL
jgi:hypothetical protein